MYVRNRVVALLFRLILIVGCMYGIYLNSGLARGVLSATMFAYYTIQSNILVLVVFAVLSARTVVELRRQGVRGATTFSPHIKGAVTLAITVTLLVYHFMLVPQMFTMYPNYRPFTLSDVLVHYYTPLMAIADWLLFDPKGRYRWYGPLLWLIAPWLYFCYAVARAQWLTPPYPAGSRYPYFFMDIDKLGWSVIPWLAGLTLGFALVGYAFYGLDALLALGCRRRGQG